MSTVTEPGVMAVAAGVVTHAVGICGWVGPHPVEDLGALDLGELLDWLQETAVYAAEALLEDDPARLDHHTARIQELRAEITRRAHV